MTIEETAGRDDAVRDLAYRLWEDAGRPEGRQDEFWYQASHALASEHVDHSGHPATPPEPADPHPTDEDPGNVFNPAPGVSIVSEQHSRDLEADPYNPGSPA